MSTINVQGYNVELSNIDKMLFPQVNIKKGDLIDYYIKYSPYVLKWLKNRPFTMVPFPDGVEGKSFYQKRIPDNSPEFLESITLPSKRKESIEWCLINNLPSLIYIVNRACIEMHTWFSRVPEYNKPDVAIFDLDPSGNTDYKNAINAAKLIHVVLEELNVKSFPKTSGATGIHIVIPIEPTPFAEVQQFLSRVCMMVEKADPEHFTTQRIIEKRGDKVYLDAVQNARGKTIPSPYSVRPTPQATVSTPLTWDEIEQGINPTDFRIDTIDQRMKKVGDLFEPVYELHQKLPVI